MTAHPRPLLARANWIELDGLWQLEFDDEVAGMAEGWFRGDRAFTRQIQVPFPPESARSGIEEDGHEVIWYRRDAALENPGGGSRVILHFDAVDYEADVWVNGVHVAHHEGGHVGFSCDVTHALNDSTTQMIVVRAFDGVTSLEQPRGKQDWEPQPHVIWYRRTSGIWRSVWAEVVNRTHLESLTWTPLPTPGELALEARLAGATEGLLELEFSLDDRVVARSAHSFVGGQLSAMIRLNDPRFASEPDRLLWSPESPTLFDIRAVVREDGQAVDAVSSYVGLRTVETDQRHFLLNGRPYFLRLVLEQAYWPDSHLSAPSEAAIRDEVELIKSLGFNGLRMHQTVADPRFLYWCDRLGLMVWADAPATYHFSTLSLSRTVREWIELVDRDASHPSVVAWVAFNESWGVPGVAVSERQRDAVSGLYHLLRSLDPSRLVIGNDGWEFVAGDLLGIHDYTQSADTLFERYGSHESADATLARQRPGNRDLVVRGVAVPAVPIVLSEFGGVAFSDTDGTWAGYGAVIDDAAFAERLATLVGAVNAADGIAGFCYTQLTDTLQERNGLANEGRRAKLDPQVIGPIIRGD